MLLTIDVGNTQTSFGIFSDSKLTHHWRMRTTRNTTVDEIAAFFLPLAHHSELEHKPLSAVLLCSVVPSVDGAFIEFSRRYLDKTPTTVNTSMALPFSINVEMPSEVGADRLANSAFAVHRMKLPAIVVDFGTATTLDVITADRVYQGGVILPGVQMGVEALGRGTSKLPIVDITLPESAIGKTTATCIQVGALMGYADMIDGLIARIEAELQESCEIALTGGLGRLFDGRLKHPCRYAPDLTLEGIALLEPG